MSLALWKKEFYKTPAEKVSKRFAVKHSLRKWVGLKKDNLKKHGVMIADSDRVINASDLDKLACCGNVDSVEIDESTCSLCIHFADMDNEKDVCEKCPLYKIGKSCWENNSPFERFLGTGNVSPMIRAIEKAIKAGG